MHITRWTASMLALATFTLAAPAAAQGKGAGKGKSQESGKATHARGAVSHAQSPAKGGANARGRGSVQAAEKSRAHVDVAQRGGQGAERGRDQGKARARGRDDEKVTGRANADTRGNARGREMEARGEVERANPPAAAFGRARSRFVRHLSVEDVRPSARRFVISDRVPERVAGRAVAYALARGVPDDALIIIPSGDRVFVRNRNGATLLDLDERRARDLGVWQVDAVDMRDKEGSPSFCRSGAGHPVWGRQWCLDKGFGLGANGDVVFGRARNPADIIFRPVTQPTLTEAILRTVLGDRAVDRLAVHALTLGLVDPLTGRFLGETTGPSVLLVTSGDRPVAEVVDVNRDGRPDDLLVALRYW